MGVANSCMNTFCINAREEDIDKYLIEDFYSPRLIISASINDCPNCGLAATIPTEDGKNNYYCKSCGCVFHSCSRIKFIRQSKVQCKWCVIGNIWENDNVDTGCVNKCSKCGFPGFKLTSTDDSPYMCQNMKCKNIWGRV
jgi:hypothetical protein